MRKLYSKRLLSLIMVILMVFPMLVSASSPENLKIKYVYFQDESGNMVFVDYEYAINQSMEGDYLLYNAIKEYVGIAEAKGRSVYLETNTGKVLDFKLAMIDNLFKLAEIIGKEKYEVNRVISYTHELKVVDGVARIEIKQDPPVDLLELVSITSVNGITVNVGTTEEAAKALLPQTTTIIDNKDGIHTVNLEWTIENYSGNVEGDYTATGRFTLPEGMKNSKGLDLKVDTIVKVYAPIVEPDWPFQVEDVFVGESPITKNTYANIKIEEEYISVVEAVYVNDMTANNMEDEKSQWRIGVADGTTVEALKGKIRVTSKIIMITEIQPVADISVEFGTLKNEAIASLQQTTTIKDSNGNLYPVDLNWEIENYNGNLAGDYIAVATFALPEGVNENPNLKLELRAKVTVEQEIILTQFTADPLLGKGFGLGKLVVYKELAKSYENATQYAVLYSVGSSGMLVLTDRADFGKAPVDLVQNLKGINVISISLYDGNGNHIGLIENIMNK